MGSIDGNQIVYTVAQPSTPGQIGFIDADGTNAHTVTVTVPIKPPIGEVTNIDLSPDGTRLAYLFTTGEGGSEIDVANADGTGATTVQGLPGVAFDVFWAPDSKRLAFTLHESTDPFGGGNPDESVWTANSDGSGLTLVADDASSPSWSPDGTRLAFVCQSPASRICTAPAAGGPETVVTTSPAGYSASEVRWSPDGAHISFEDTSTSSSLLTTILRVVGVDGTGLRALFSPPGGDGYSWSPDGHRMVFSDAGADLIVVNLSGAVQARLAGTAGAAAPSWIRANPTTTVGGYRLAGADGGVFAFGDAAYLGSEGGQRLNQPVVGMADTPDRKGYWLVAADGGIFAFGDAAFYGSTGAIHLNQPVVGMAATPDGGGYWLAASDGGIFAFGHAAFHGSAGALALAQPVTGMAATPDGGGYWLAAADGGIFTYGDAAFEGSAVGPLTSRVIGIQATASGRGYTLAGNDGTVDPIGDATYNGTTPPLNKPVVGIAR